MCSTNDVIICRKYATQMKSSYGRDARNDQSNRRIDWRKVFKLSKIKHGKSFVKLA